MTAKNNKQLAQQGQEFFNPEELFRPIGEVRRNAPPLEPLWGYFLFKKAITSVVGDPGVCKCIDEDTLIPIEDGTLVPAKEYSPEHRILSMDEKTYKLCLDKPDAFVDNGYKECLRIKTHTGREIVVTPEHPFLTIEGWKRADKIALGEKIATPRIIPIEGNKEVAEHELKLLAYLIAEGGLTQNSPCFTSGKQVIIDEFLECISHYPEVRTREMKERGNCLTYAIVAIEPKHNEKGHMMPNQVGKILQQYGLFKKRSSEKTIPRQVYNLPNRQLAIFLNRLFAGDGWCHAKHPCIEYYTISRELIYGIQHLLLRFGILSKVMPRTQISEQGEYDYYTIYITDGDSLTKFISKIGILGQEAQLQEAKEYLERSKRNPNLDVIPTTPELRVRIRRKYDWTLKDNISRERLARLEPENLLAYSDIFWDSVILTESAGVRHVYDLCMPKRNFIAGNFVVHNTTWGYGLAKELCLGQAFLDISAEEPVNALYMDFESADSLVASRANLVIGDTEVPNFYIYNIVDYYLPQIAKVTIDFCKGHSINLVFVDNQSMAFSTRDENDNAEAIKQMRFLRSFTVACNAACVSFHHTSKANLPGTRKGTGAFARARLADVCINLEIPVEDEPDIVRLETAKNRLVDEKVLWYFKKEEGKFTLIEPPLGISGQPTNTIIYKVQTELLSLLRNGSSPEMKFKELIDAMAAKGFSENWVDHAARRLLQQNRIYKPRYGYYAIKKMGNR